MKKCWYCGRVNENETIDCTGCGCTLPEEVAEEIPDIIEAVPALYVIETASPPAAVEAISVPPIIPVPPVIVQAAREYNLDGGFATMLFAIFLGTQAAAASIYFFLSAMSASATGQSLKSVVSSSFSLLVIFMLLASLIMVVFTAAKLIPTQLKHIGSTGAAWAAGPSDPIGLGLISGAGWGMCASLLVRFFSSPVKNPLMSTEHLGLFASRFNHFLLFISAVLLAPIVEELLFRGVMYAGYRKSFGPGVATIVTTVLFVSLHVFQGNNAVSLSCIAVLALLALWFRLWYRAIGPAIAFHSGYNLLVMLFKLA